MYIEKIIIYDFVDKRVNKYDFTNSANIFVSKENTIGKSSLIKSLYYALGFEIKIWPDKWCADNMIFQLSVNHQNTLHTITRKGKAFYLNEDKEELSEKEYSIWLQSLLGLNLKIKDKRSNTLTDVYASEVLLPFYIDQDKSWNGYVFSKTSDSYGRYNRTVEKVLDFNLDIVSKKLIDLEISKSQLEVEVNKEQKKVEMLKVLHQENLIPFINNNESNAIPLIEFEYLEGKLEDLNILNHHISKIDADIIEIDRNINDSSREIKELTKLAKEYRGRFDEIEHFCIYCESKLTTEQSLKRFKIRNNLYEIEDQIKSFTKDRDMCLKAKSSKFQNRESLKFQMFNLEYEIKSLKRYEDLNPYIENKVYQSIENNYAKVEDRLYSTLSQHRKKSEEINMNIKKEKKVGAERKKEIKKRYDELKNEYEIFFNDFSLQQYNFYKFKEVAGSGMDSNKKMLVLYTIYSNLVSEYAMYKLPFGMDSFIKNETSNSLKKEMFEFLAKYYLSMQGQIFFSIIEENKQYLGRNKKYNFIDLEKPILQSITHRNENLIEVFDFLKSK